MPRRRRPVRRDAGWRVRASARGRRTRARLRELRTSQSAVRRLLASRPLAERLGREGRALVEREFDAQEAAAARVVDVVHAAIEAASTPRRPSAREREATQAPELSVVAPVFNGAAFIAENVEIIRRDLGAAGLRYELIVVSDGSVDETVERAVAAGHPEVRVLHYERNLGKGYAVKLGLLAARAPYVGFIDSDLDLHPAELPRFLPGHAASRASMPPSARNATRSPRSTTRGDGGSTPGSTSSSSGSLFRLDVRDTQVGIKVFRRELIDAVVPHLLVKRYAFDLELLAVAHDAGFRRIVELPVRLEYGFTGSGISPLAVAQALLDTAAIFYRLRILRYYRRRSAIVGDTRGPDRADSARSPSSIPGKRTSSSR